MTEQLPAAIGLVGAKGSDIMLADLASAVSYNMENRKDVGAVEKLTI